MCLSRSPEGDAMLILICSLLLESTLPRTPAALDLSDTHCIAGQTTQLVAQISPPEQGIQVEFFLNRSSLGIARTDSQGVAVLETGVTPAIREIPFTAATLHRGQHLQSKARWFTSAERPAVVAREHAASLF